MGTIYHNKLVRDKIPDVIRQAGKQPITDILSQNEMTTALHMADHKIILGRCCVTGNDPSAHCNACGKDFGKPPYLRRRKGQAVDAPRELYWGRSCRMNSRVLSRILYGSSFIQVRLSNAVLEYFVLGEYHANVD